MVGTESTLMLLQEGMEQRQETRYKTHDVITRERAQEDRDMRSRFCLKVDLGDALLWKTVRAKM